MQLTVKDVSSLLEVSDKTVYRWIEDGKLPGYRISGQYRFNRAELLAWATANRIHVSTDIFQEPETLDARPASLEAALQEGGIHYRVTGVDPKTCLRRIVDMLRLPQEVDREFLYQVLWARESLDSTAVGEGVAIPHLRNPIVLHLQRPLLAICFLENPIDFGALDGQPVKVLIPLVTPTIKSHLQLLSRLSFGLRNPDFKALLDRQATREELQEGVRRISEAGSHRSQETLEVTPA
jgi:PTS system nitrogen regulatory IIA component